MALHDLTKAGPTQHASAPVCIIGGGMAGLVAARRFAALGVRVIVVESGALEFDPAPNELNRIVNTLSTHKGAEGGRFRCLGGTSVRWGGRLLPLSENETGSRPHVDLPAWPLDMRSLDGYGLEIEELFRVDQSSYTSSVLDKFQTRSGVPLDDEEIVVRCPKWVGFKQCNLGRLLRDEIRGNPNIELWLNATVTRLDFNPEQEALTEIVARDPTGRTLHVVAKHFLIASGAIEATRLMLLLNQQSNGRAFSTCNVLGRYFMDHVGLNVARLIPKNRSKTNAAFGYRFIRSVRRSLHFEASSSAQSQHRIASAFAHVTMIAAQDSSTDLLKRFLRGLQVGKFVLSGSDIVKLLSSSSQISRGLIARYWQQLHYWPNDLGQQLNIWIEQLPHFDNRIELADELDIYGVPKASITWRQMQSEEHTFDIMIKLMKSYWDRYSFGDICELRWEPTIQSRERPLTESATDTLHPAGSTRMGTDPRQSVVNPNLQCHSVQNLSVASASVFPSCGATNPTYAILQLALHAANSIAGRLK